MKKVNGGTATGTFWFVCEVCGKWDWCRVHYGFKNGKQYSYIACLKCKGGTESGD